MARFILPALALAGTALAQCNGSVTITTSSDAEALSSCTKYNGDITIDPSASGQISIDGVQTITGDFTCINATQLTSLGASTLQTIEGTFNLQDLTILSSLSMSYLNAVNKINWITLPALQSLNFANGISQANTVYISNTALTTLSGIELTQVGSIDVNNNNYLKTINVNSLTNVTNALSFSANGLNLDVEFPNLQNAANLTFRNISSLSMPSLSMVEGAMGFYSNYFDSFEAPNMTQIGGTIAFVSNSAITNISFPQLESTGGGLQLANNSQLATINGFPQLTEIQGDIDFYGTFNTVQLPKLTDVRGAANVFTSSQNSSVCTLFKEAKSQQLIKGNVNCQTNAQNSLTNGSSTSSGSGSSSTSKSAADSSLFDPSAPLTGFAALIAALLFI